MMKLVKGNDMTEKSTNPITHWCMGYFIEFKLLKYSITIMLLIQTRKEITNRP